MKTPLSRHYPPAAAVHGGKKITLAMVLERQYRNLEVEHTKFKLEIEKLQLEKEKLKLEIQRLLCNLNES